MESITSTQTLTGYPSQPSDLIAASNSDEFTVVVGNTYKDTLREDVLRLREISLEATILLESASMSLVDAAHESRLNYDFYAMRNALEQATGFINDVADNVLYLTSFNHPKYPRDRAMYDDWSDTSSLTDERYQQLESAADESRQKRIAAYLERMATKRTQLLSSNPVCTRFVKPRLDVDSSEFTPIKGGCNFEGEVKVIKPLTSLSSSIALDSPICGGYSSPDKDAKDWIDVLVNSNNKSIRGICDGFDPSGLVTFSWNDTLTIPEGSSQIDFLWTPQVLTGRNQYAGTSGSTSIVIDAYVLNFSAVYGSSNDIPNLASFQTGNVVYPAPLAGYGSNFTSYRLIASELSAMPVGPKLTQSGNSLIGGFTDSTNYMMNQPPISALPTARFRANIANDTAWRLCWFPTDVKDTPFRDTDPMYAVNVDSASMIMNDPYTEGLYYYGRITGSAGTAFNINLTFRIEYIPTIGILPFVDVKPPVLDPSCLAKINITLLNDKQLEKKMIGPMPKNAAYSGFNVGSAGGMGSAGMGKGLGQHESKTRTAQHKAHNSQKQTHHQDKTIAHIDQLYQQGKINNATRSNLISMYTSGQPQQVDKARAIIKMLNKPKPKSNGMTPVVIVEDVIESGGAVLVENKPGHKTKGKSSAQHKKS